MARYKPSIFVRRFWLGFKGSGHFGETSAAGATAPFSMYCNCDAGIPLGSATLRRLRAPRYSAINSPNFYGLFCERIYCCFL